MERRGPVPSVGEFGMLTLPMRPPAPGDLQVLKVLVVMTLFANKSDSHITTYPAASALCAPFIIELLRGLLPTTKGARL